MKSHAVLPPDHPQRQALAAELHARPPAPVQAPAVVSFAALTDAPPAQSLAALSTLAAEYGVAAPPADVGHTVIELPAVRIKWERHGEFVSLTLVAPAPALALSAALAGGEFPSAFAALPTGWLSQVAGRVMAAGDILLVPAGTQGPSTDAIGAAFVRDSLAGSSVLDEAAWLFTDFMLGANGRTRWLAIDVCLGRAQAARVIQRIVDIEVYRMMALLAFPPARAVAVELTRIEQELERITAATAALHESTATPAAQNEERRLLDELSRVAAEVEKLTATNAYRFAAGQAYWDLVRARVTEFREHRAGDLRTLGGFLNRRMAPAMNTCAAAARRQEALSARIERASSLLRTRVDVAREEQNQQLLAAMERRGLQQLRLQQTVEGLSVAAIAYYSVGLLSYLLKPLESLWPRFSPQWVIAAAVPLVAFAVWRGLRRIRRSFDER